jgi:hypothetical protein
MMDRLRSLPTWLRILLAATPVLMCIPLACIVVFASQQFSTIQAATATGAVVNTQQAAASTQLAEQELAAALTATAAIEQTNLGITATFLFDQALSLTLTAQATPTFTASPILPTETPTQPVVFATLTPKLLTVTLRECRGDEGTVLFGSAQPQSINAFKSLSFTVPPGKYDLRIFWLRKKENNINTQIDVKTDQTIPFGGDCR